MKQSKSYLTRDKSMAREVDDDFKHLTNFVDDYSLTALLKETAYRPPLKQGHSA